MARQRMKKTATQTTDKDVPLYTLEVFIINGPMTESFARSLSE
jgi:hypothetical protein